MATKPGMLTDWPWKPLGSLKVLQSVCHHVQLLCLSFSSILTQFDLQYIMLAPWAMHSVAKAKNGLELDYFNLLILPFLLSRALHNQIWISFSRHRTAKGNNKISQRPIEFQQVDRETNWSAPYIFFLVGVLTFFFFF